MPVFEWEGRSLGGETKKGVQTSDSIDQLRVSVRRDGVILIKATEKKEAEDDTESGPRQKDQAGPGGYLHPSAFYHDNERTTVGPVLDILSNQLENATFGQ
jgi:hypothetical protein